VIIEHQDLALMKIMVFSKVVPATSKKSITFAIVIHLQHIRWAATRHLSEYSLPKLTAIHELCEFHGKTLLLAALGTSESQEGKQIAC
jgi:hypothetical protein